MALPSDLNMTAEQLVKLCRDQDATIDRMKNLLRACRKNIDDVIQYRLVEAIATELKD